MNFAEIETMWRSPQNRPTAAQLEEIKMKFVTDLKKRHRTNTGFLVFIFILLAFFTGTIVRQAVWPEPSLDRVDLGREWGVIPFLALPWAGWLALMILHRRHRRRHPDYERSVRASVAALLDENRMERMRYKLVAGLLGASMVVLPLIVHQLRAVGKAGDEILLPAFVIFPGYVLLTSIGLAFSYRRKLLPRKRELEALLASYA